MTHPTPRTPTVRLEVPDYDHGLRGKLVRADKAAPAARASMCTIVYGLSICDEVVDTPLSSAGNGYPDAFATPDEDTRVELPWLSATQAVIADMYDEDGELLPESPRTVVKKLLEGFRAIDLSPTFGYEFEAYVTRAGDSALEPLGTTISAYSLLRVAEAMDLAEEFMARMESIGVSVEAFHSELGPGFFEFALSPAPALTSTDNAARARQFFRELCAERGLRATFMAKLHIHESGSGGHVHQSIVRHGENVFSDGQGKLSELGGHYVGGLLATMGDMSLLFNPNLNSYKRLGAAFFVATRATWGYDNRNAACRAILNCGSKAARVEHRRPGADASPYLVAAGMLAGGLHGLRESVDPGAPLKVGDDVEKVGTSLPANLQTALQEFRVSRITNELLGERFVSTYAATRQGEIDAFERWWNSSITDWEKSRYLEHL